MADTRMSVEERQQFLADLYVGVLAVPRADGPPLTAPIWYDYVPGGNLWVLVGPTSRKGRLLAEGSEVTLVAQSEALPYKYVSVEGRVASIAPADTDADTRPMAHRYLGKEMGDAYVAGTEGESVRVTIEPQRWLTVDYAKTMPAG